MLYHVSSARNRESIRAHGLDWTRMGAARGIAGAAVPEVDGVFLCASEFDAMFFVRVNNTGGPVDLWGVDGVDEDELLTSPEGFRYLPAPIAPAQLTWLREEAVPVRPRPGDSSGAYRSTLTITYDDEP